MTVASEMPCAELVERVTDYLEGALGPSVRRRLEAHLADCDACSLYLAQLRETIRLTGELREDDLDQRVRERLARAFGDWRASG